MMTVAKAKIDGSITQLLQSNFDQDSKIVIITILKILDNILQQPYNDKVRKIRLQNKAFHKKVVSKKGGIDVLVACGFQLQKAPPKLLESSTSLSSSSSSSPDEFLILTEALEDTDTIVLARQMLHQVAIHQLRCPPDEVPPMKPPLRKQPLSTSLSSSSSSSTTTTHQSTGFNVYQGQRYDGQSAAVGTNLGPPQNWKSATDAKLERLQKQQQQLERKLQNPKQLSHDRQWKASLTPLTNASLLASLTSSSSSSTNDNTASSFSSSSDNDDKALLAQHLQKQHQQRLKEENRGFTTKAMRDLEKIKHQKVYSHVVLAIQFQDGCTIKGHFLPKDTLQTVKDELASSVFVDSSGGGGGGASVPNDYELYVTPPRTILDPNSTLQALGLVPASKIYVSWKTPLSPPPRSPLGAGSGGGSLPSGWYVRQSLFDTNTVTTTSLPASEVVGESATTTTNATSSTKPAVAKKKKKTKAEKEAAMLQRMMGK